MYLCDEDSEDDAQLVEGPQSSSQGRRGDLTHIHGHETCGEARVETHHETTDDEHFPGARHLREPHQSGSDERQDVGHEHRVPPGEQAHEDQPRWRKHPRVNENHVYLYET